MTFRAARLRLTAWFAAVFSLVLLVLGAATYLALTSAIDRQIDAGIHETMTQWLTAAPDLSALPALAADRTHEEETADVFLLAFRTDGVLVANPRRVATHDLLEEGAIDPRATAASQRTVDVEHERVRVHVLPVVSGGVQRGVLIGGRSLRERDVQVRNVVVVLGGVAGGGLALAVAAGYALAGRALRPLAEAHRRQQLFIADASHELRTPITIVRTSADLLLRNPAIVDPDRESIQEIRDVADEAGRLIEQLLQLARMEQAPEDDTAINVDLAEAAAIELDRLRPLLEAHGTIVSRALAPAPGAMSIDEAHRVMRALIENIITHTPAGTRASVATSVEGDHAMLVLADEGPGVSPTDRATIFERFARKDRARTPGAGSGLGLAIVAAIARRRRGTVTASSVNGVTGLRIEFRVPLAGSDET